MRTDERQDLISRNEKSDRVGDAEEAENEETRQPIAFAIG